MASITERGGRYLVRVRRNGYPTVTKTFTRKSDGLAWARRTEGAMELGNWIDESVKVEVTPTLRAAIKEYRLVVVPAMKGAAEYRWRLDEFEALPFAAKPINEVTATDFAKWRDAQSELHKPATVVRKLAMLSGIFTWALKERSWVVVNPLCAVRKPRCDDGRSRTLSPDEVACLMTAARTSKATWLSATLTVLMYSAMRRSELFGLKRGDVDFTASVARLHETKAGGGRDVPLCPRSLEALRELDRAAADREDEALMPFKAVGSLTTRFTHTVQRARAVYEAECLAAGVAPDDAVFRDLRLHDLRHHAVTRLATTGALSLVELMACSGHRTSRMVLRYSHLKASTLAAKLTNLSA